jgi:uncharacterized membrane protein YdjX (TVP38/TMEM64 family)
VSLLRRQAKPIAFALALAVLVAAALLFPVRAWLLGGIEFIQTHRETAWVMFVLAYICATVLLIPGSILTLAAGFVFGLPLGVALVSAGSVTGATAAFLVGRFFARDWVTERIAALPKFRALDTATRREGFAIVFLARLSPLFPFNLLNYGLGITGVGLRDYFFASWIGMLPGTVLYVYIGTLAQNLAELGSGEIGAGTAGRVLLVAGFVATIALTILITRKATRALESHLGGSGEPRESAPEKQADSHGAG